MVPKFRTTEITPPETLGEKLKRVRGDLKLSLDEVEKSTKIRKKYIKALEANDYSVLPPDVYTKGFLKNYAKILGVSEEKVLDSYKKERGIVENIKKSKKKTLNTGRNLKSPKVIITPRTIIFFLTSVVAIIIMGYIVFNLFSFSASPKLEIISPQNNTTVTKSFVDIKGKTDSGAEVYINGQKINTSEEGEFKVNVGIGQKGVNLLKVTAKNPRNGKTTEKITNIIAEISEISIPTPGSAEVSSDNIALGLKIGPSTTWISIKKDGKKDFEGIMLPGTTRNFEASSELILTTGNAGSTEVIFNGKNIGKLGNEGEVKTDLKFDKNTKV